MDESKQAWILVLPALVTALALNLFPTAYAVLQSLSKNDPTGAIHLQGLQNYGAIVVDHEFQQSAVRTLEFTVISVSLGTLVGLGLALIANENFRGRSFLRGILVIPWATPVVLAGIIWSFILDYQHGYANNLLAVAHLPRINFLAVGNVMVSVAFSAAWVFSSLSAIFVLSALQGIDPAYLEAATIDGAGTISRFRYITLPHIRPVLGITVLLNIVLAMSMFDLIYVVTGGGPGVATLVLSIEAFRQYFLDLNLGTGSAEAVILALLTIGVGSIYLTGFYRRVKS